NGEFFRDEDRRIYEEMRMLEATDTYTDDEINRLARGGKQRGHIPGVGRVLLARATASPTQQGDLPHYVCDNDYNYTRNSSFERNLDRILANLPLTKSGYGFFNSSSGQDSDAASAIALCRADIQAIPCAENPLTDWRAANVTDDVPSFTRDLLNLLSNLTAEAAAGGSLLKYAAGTMTRPNSEVTYALVQCTPDLSEQQCTNCLKDT
nr:cysteine-rich RLK (receptor-like protein kinase) 26 [Tanacetum cinerariifolium]